MSCQSTYTTKNEALVGQNLPAAVLGCSRKNFAAQQLAGAPAACSRNMILDEEKSFFETVFNLNSARAARGLAFTFPEPRSGADSRRVRDERDSPDALYRPLWWARRVVSFLDDTCPWDRVHSHCALWCGARECGRCRLAIYTLGPTARRVLVARSW